MTGLIVFVACLAVLDWIYARVSLRDERRYRRDLQRRTKEYIDKQGGN
jgi:hypothetical protein